MAGVVAKIGCLAANLLKFTILYNNMVMLSAFYHKFLKFQCMKNIVVFLLLASVTSCVSTNKVHISVLEPSPVTLPPSVQKVGIINRSETDPKNKVFDVVDKVLSLESATLDKEGAAASIDALQYTLKQNDRFHTVTPVSGDYYRQSTSGIFPAPLAWTDIEGIAKKNNADLLFSLEVFDTESKVNYATGAKTLNTPLGKVPMVEHIATMVTRVRAGWRIYAPAERQILDEYVMHNTLSFEGRGINPAAALAAMLERKEAVKATGNRAGEAYGQRILPYYLRVSRDYYVKGSDAFKTAKRRAQGGNWSGAAELWEKETANSKAKIAGRACYNMAIINEINGKLDEAIGWAQKAYADYNIRLALQYIKVLENRKISNSILNDQAKR